MARAAQLTGRVIKILLKTVAWLVGGVIGLVVVALVALNFLLQTGFFTRFVLDRALPPVEKLTCSKIEVQKLRLSLLPFSLLIEGARYTDPHEKFAHPFGALKRLYVHVKTAPLLRGRVVVDEVTVEGAENYLYLRDGVENLPICPSPPKPKKPFHPFQIKLPIIVKNVSVDAKFRLDMPARTRAATPDNPNPQPIPALAVAVESIKVEAHGDLHRGDVAAKVRLGGASASIGEMRDQVRSLSVDAEANLQSWVGKVTQLAIEMPDLHLSATAQVANLLTGLDLTSDVKLEVDARKVNQLVLMKPADIQLAGLLTLTAQGRFQLVGNKKPVWAAQGAIALPQAQVNRLPVRDLHAQYIVTRERVHITGFHAAVGAGVVDLSGELGLENTLPFDADVKLASVNVGDILGSFGQAKLGLGGVASANLHTKGQITPLLVAANGSVALGGARYQEMIRLDKLAMRLDASVDRTGAAGNLRFKAHTTMDLQDLVYTQTVKAKPDAVAHTETVEVAAGNLTLDVSGAVPLKKGPPIDLSARGDVELQDARYADQAHVERVAVSLDGKMHIGSRVAYEAQVNLTADEVSQGDRITAQKVELVLDAGGDVTANEVRQLKLTVDGVHVKQANLTHLTLDAAGLFGPKKNEVRQFVLTTDHTRVTATGAFDLDHGPLSGVADLEFADLAEFAALVDKPLGGRGTLHLQAAGTTDHPQVEGRLDFADLLYGAINLKRISGGLGYDGNRAKVVQLVIEREGARITVDGWYDRLDSTVQAALDMPETQIAELLALAGLQDQVQVTGKLTLHAAVSGPVKKLNGQVMLTGAEITAYGENVQAVQLNARLVGGEVELDELSLVKERGVRPLIQNGVWKPRPAGMVTDADREPMKLTISGRLNPNDRTFALKLRTQQLNETASDIVAQHRLHVMADVGLTADVAGTFDNPNGSLLLTIDRGRYEQYDLGQSTIKVDFAAQQVHLTGVLLAARQAFASDVAAPHPTPTPSPTPTADPDFAASATPTPGTPAPPANPNDLGAIRLDATLGLTDARPFKARVTFDHFDYSNFLKSAAQARQQRQQARSGARLPAGNQEKFGGLVDGEIDLDGRLGASGAQQTGTAPVAGVVAPAKPSLSATVRFNQILFQRNNLLIRNQNEAGEVKPIVITYRDGRVDVQDFALGGSGVEIKIERQDLGGEAYFVLNGQAPLDTVKAFTDAVANVNGALQLHAEIPVAFDLDKVKAAVKIDNATVDLADVPTNIENLKVDVEFANRAATIRQFTAKVGGGTLRVGGSYRLPQPARPAAGTAAAPTAPTAAEHAQLEVFAKIENVTTRFDPYLELVVRKVDLLATSRPDGKIDVTGEVDINKAVLRYNIDLVQILQAFQKRSGGATGSQVYEKKEESVYFNIVIRAPQGVSIDNNFIQMEMSLDLVLTGNNVDVGLIGSVESTKGEATVLQNTYKVTSAVIQFFDETRIYPAFDVNAETTVNNINIFISVTGTPDRYQITFQSDPPMNERDIVTLLSLGVSYEQFQAGSGDEAAALAAAAQQLIGSSFRQYTGIDFGVDSTTGVSRLRVSRPLQEHFLMSLYRGISDPTLSAETEWDFTRNLGLYVGWSDFAGQENVPSYGGFGGGVRVKIEFR